MGSTYATGNDIPIPKIFVVGEASEHSNQEDITNRNQETGLSNHEDFQGQEESQSTIERNISHWNGLYVFVILGTCVACTSMITMIPIHNIFEYPEFWWEHIFHGSAFVVLFYRTLPMTWEVYLLFHDEFFNAKLFSVVYFTAFYLGFNITCLLYTSPSPRDLSTSRMPSSA